MSLKTYNKTVELKAYEPEESELEEINKYTLEPVQPEDVFTFKALAGTNLDNDRNFAPFSAKALKDLANLYAGVAMIKNHDHRSEPIARVYKTEIVEDITKTGIGGCYTELYLKMYMPVTDANADLIKEIITGMRKEVSTSCIPEKLTCSICGMDNMKTYCPHFAGIEYHGQTCKMVIEGATDAIELSFVIAGAQPTAGVVKAENDDLNTRKMVSRYNATKLNTLLKSIEMRKGELE